MILKCCSYSYCCGLREFSINGKNADYNDFGDKYDTSPENAEDYGCGNMRFIKKQYTKTILKKYKITILEYNKICNKLEKELSFGECDLCS